jgi:hypothetical protein
MADTEKSAKQTAKLLQESQKTGQALGLTFDELASVQDSILNGTIKTTAKLTEQLALVKQQVTEARKLEEVTQSIESSYEDFVDLSDSFNSNLKAAAKLDKTRLKTLNDNVKEMEKALAAAEQQHGYDQQNVADLKAQLELRKKQIEEASKLREQLGESTLTNLNDSISSISEGIKGMVPEPLQKMLGVDNLEDSLFSMAEKFPVKMVAGFTVIAGALMAAFSLISQINEETQKTADATGLTFSEAEKLVKASYETAASGDMILANQQDILAASEALVQEFGQTDILAGDTAANLAELSKAMGYSAQSGAKLQSILMNAGGASSEMALGIQQAGASLAEAYGVPFDDVIQDIAESGEEVAKYFSGMPRDAVKTTVQLKAMGLSLKQAGKMADHLLDIEASLKAETKAQIMLNKNINLDKARQLAAEGKIAEAAAEATRQIGSAAEFAKMDQFQKKAAAEAAGLTLEELSKTYIMQEKMANMSQEQKDLVEKYGDKLGDISKLDKDQIADKATQLQQQENIAAAFDNIKASLINAIMPALEAIGPLFGFIGKVINIAFKPLFYAITGIKMMIDYVNKLTEQFTWMQTIFDQIKNIAIGIGTILIISWLPSIYSFVAGLITSLGSMISLAFSGIAAAIGPIFSTFSMIPFGIGIPLAIAAVAGLGALVNKYIDDGIVPPAGGGGNGYSRVLSGPEGSIAFNDKDTIVAGTDLGGGGGGSSADLSPLVAAVQQTNALLAQMINNPAPVLIGDEALRKIGRNVKVQNSRGA